MAFLPDAQALGDLLARVRQPLGTTATSPIAVEAPVPTPRVISPPPPKPEQAAPEPLRASRIPPLGAGGAFPLANLARRLEEGETLQARLVVLARWLEECTGAQAAFISDAEGLSMAETNAEEHVIAAAGAVRAALESVRTMLPAARTGALSVVLTPTQQLELCECDSNLGALVVGLVTATPCAPEWRAWLPKAVALATAEPYRRDS